MQNQFQPTTRSKSRRHVEAFPVGSKRVLVADEDPAFLRRVTETIDRNGFRAMAACNGREALKILQRDSDFVAAIFAVAMSDIQGPELVRYMKTEKRLMQAVMKDLTHETLSTVSQTRPWLVPSFELPSR